MKVEKCTSVKNGYAKTNCQMIKSTSKPYSKRAKGLMHSTIVNTETEERFGLMFTLTQNDQYVGLSVCPFCGGELRDLSYEEAGDIANRYRDIALIKSEK